MHKHIDIRIKKEKLFKIKQSGSTDSGLISDTRKQFKRKWSSSWLPMCACVCIFNFCSINCILELEDNFTCREVCSGELQLSAGCQNSALWNIFIFFHAFLVHCYNVCIQELVCFSVKSCPLIKANDLNLCLYWNMCVNLLYLLRVKSTLKGYHLLNSMLKMQVGCQLRRMKNACYVIKVKSWSLFWPVKCSMT